MCLIPFVPAYLHACFKTSCISACLTNFLPICLPTCYLTLCLNKRKVKQNGTGDLLIFLKSMAQMWPNPKKQKKIRRKIA